MAGRRYTQKGYQGIAFGKKTIARNKTPGNRFIAGQLNLPSAFEDDLTFLRSAHQFHTAINKIRKIVPFKQALRQQS